MIGPVVLTDDMPLEVPPEVLGIPHADNFHNWKLLTADDSFTIAEAVATQFFRRFNHFHEVMQ